MDHICRIKCQIKYRYPDDEDSDDDTDEPGDPDELFVQLDHARSHARNLDPSLRWTADPDSVICQF